MTKQPVDISTTASVEDAAALFRTDMRANWFGENNTGIATTFTESGGSPLGIHHTDMPDLALTAELVSRGESTERLSVHLLIWDRGECRKIRLEAEGNVRALRILANRKMRRFVVSLQEEDPSLTYTGI
ncbi:hypothetical protein ACIOC1_05940 [Streptomyces sp. NPDC088197]|uniref:hypothetical protein n=1 Tax=unclassified Streptomyces TaxID=2593676 RepID=UPI0033ADA254